MEKNIANIMEYKKLDVNICNSAFCNVFKKIIPKFIRPESNQVLIDARN